jgi:catalase
LQLPVNAPATAPNINLSGGKMTHNVDDRGGDRHVNYEPSTLAGLSEAGR